VGGVKAYIGTVQQRKNGKTDMRLETIPQSDGVKVVIGTRTWVGEDWIHVDIDEFPLWDPVAKRRMPVDVVCDAENLQIADNFADLVFSSEAIEHFSWRKTGDVIKEWARILKPGGTMVIEAPDFAAACAQLLATETLENHLAMQQIFFAEQLNPYDIHFAGITHLTLPHFFEQAGLEVVDVKRGSDWGWLRCEGVKL
jgi:SAM-dependent methyltransferase